MTQQENALIKLMEECNEVAHRCSKALRFSLEEIQKDQLLTNSARIRGEMAGLLAAYNKLIELGALDWPTQHEVDDAVTKQAKYFEYSKQVGTVTL